MFKFYLIAFCLFAIYLNESNAVKDPKVVCYYEYWGYYRTGNGKMTVSDIDSSLCTHLVYAYLGISDSYQIDILDPNVMTDKNDFVNFVKNKGNAKAMVAIGGANQLKNFPRMAANEDGRTAFVDSVVAFMTKYHFDGVMIDWQYPLAAEIDYYTKLLDKFDQKFAGTQFTLGISGSPNKDVVNAGFDVRKIVEFVDFINVLTLDLHGLWESKVDDASPLEWQIDLMKFWWSKGVPKDKLIMAVPLFARTWTLSDPASREKGSTAKGGGTPGPYTNVSGLLSYNELCSSMKSNPTQWSETHNTEGTAVYAVNGKEWVSFEDTKTIAAKAKNATTEGYGGVTAYALTNDDIHGFCSETKFPLLHAINSGLNREPVKEVPPPTQDPKVTQPTHAAATDAPGVFKCHSEGFFADVSYPCTKYHECAKTDISGVWEDKVTTCPHGEVVDEVAHKCNQRESVPKCNH